MKKVRDGYKITELGEIPSDWNIMKLSEVAEIVMGQSPDSSSYNDTEDGVAFFQGKTEFGRINPVVKKWCNNPTKISKPLDILISVRAPVGDVNINNIEACIGRGLGAIRATSSSNYKYLYYAIQKYNNQLKKASQGSTFEAINSNDLKGLKLPIPHIDEQEKIALILSNVDEQIDNVDALIEKNKELKKGLMQTLLTKGIGHTKFKKTEIGEIPEEWDVKKLECVFEILDSMRKPIKASDREKIEGNIPYYGASGVIDWINDYIFDEELILLGEDGENLNSRNSDLAFKISGKTWVNNHAHVFRVINKKECNIDFMVYYLEAKDYSIYIAGSAQPKITQAQCRKFLLPLPEKQEQDKIASILLESDKKIEEYENKKQKLEELKKGLMQQLLTGMIRVTV
ncbi:restriction endonuclease subunit S [uncultured Clostridium sp.]|uniref:restriction endonuclease subunit S n=2 Tax=uncultured Clostridium sp. TaxID=59620 RepID=UPI0026739E2D|nr:restriction endonuclease subunit S [uncultured Clostridium sp.]